MSTKARKANGNIDLTLKTAVIAGGSQGIGAGVALRFAQAGANVVVIGRNQERLDKVVSEARKVAKSADQKFDYVSADLSLISGIKTAAKEVEAKTNGKVDYLIQTQGGMPNGIYKPTTEGIESHFAVQVLNRFLLSYVLASSGVLKDTSISVMAPGGNQTEFDIDDIELTSSKDAGRYVHMGKHISRDSVITDTYTKALQSKFPHIKFFHVSPGLVQTEVMINQGVPFPIRELITYVIFPIASRTFGNTPTSYADIPVFLAANGGRENTVEKEGYFLDNNLKKMSPSPYAIDEKNQQAVFEKLKGYLEDH
jgi:NAD(P)-dependent dehydrogenase (short-subunit alcohol dehydrogenase family)